MDFENYLTQTIMKAVNKAIKAEIGEFKEVIIHEIKSQNRTNMPVEDSKIIRPKELANMLSISIPTLYRMQHEDKLPPKVKMSSRAVGWLRSDIDDWLESKKIDL